MDTNNVTEIVPNVDSPKELKIYTGVAGRILNMLCSGCSPEEAAAAVGVDSSMVRHLKQEPDFIEQIKRKLQENTERAIAIDENYAAIEKQATDRLRTLVGLIHTPRDLIAVAQFANAAKKKTSIGGPAVNSEGAAEQRLVKIMMPTVVLNNFTVNPNNEIVEAGGRTLTTLNSTSINSLVNRVQEQQVIDQQQELSKPALLPNHEAKPSRSSNHVSAEDLDKL